jgi:hypothetical protein
MDFSSPATLFNGSTAGSILFNQPDGDGNEFVITEDIVGADGFPLRTTIEEIPRGDGGIWHPAYAAGRSFTVAGHMLIRSGNVEHRRAMEDRLMTACDFLRGSIGGGWEWTPPGGVLGGFYPVFCEILPVYRIGDFGPLHKAFVFTLFTTTPQWQPD